MRMFDSPRPGGIFSDDGDVYLCPKCRAFHSPTEDLHWRRPVPRHPEIIALSIHLPILPERTPGL